MVRFNRMMSVAPTVRSAVFCLFFLAYLGQASDGWRGNLSPWAREPELPFKSTPLRLGVFASDIWVESLDDGGLLPRAEVPLSLHQAELLKGADFTPEVYLDKAPLWSGLRTVPYDVLMYYGGRRNGARRVGLNFNSWSTLELRRLHERGARPFIGLETFEPSLVREMAQALRDGGFADGRRLYVRLGSEPATMAYGLYHGRRTPEACAAYKQKFLRTAKLLRDFGRRYGLNFRIVFAGNSAKDFERYMPDADRFDAIGFDLYVTPANIHQVLPLLEHVSRHWAHRPLVIPELGIATAGESTEIGYRGVRATPRWARAALAEALMILGKRPAAPVEQMTIFSVDVAGRLALRRWNWAWTPLMFAMLDEWQKAPRQWMKSGFHRYDPRTYPIGRDILYGSKPGLRLYCQKLAPAPGQPQRFLEKLYWEEQAEWKLLDRIVKLTDQGLLLETF